MKLFWRNMIRQGLSLLFPGRCPFCDGIIPMGAFQCGECGGKLPVVRQPFCCKCGQPLEDGRREYCADCTRKRHSYTRGRAVYVYEGAVKTSLYRFKYGGRREYAACYARQAAESYGAWIRELKPEALVPVPLHPRRRRKRGYNQAELFARELGERLGLPVYSRLVRRRVDTRPQKELNDVQRKKNLKNAFTIPENIVQLKKVLLVDDIYTTGSTVDAVAEALRAAGVEQVYVLCISIGRGY